MILSLYLDGKESCQIDLCNGFGHRLVLNASSFRFDLVQFVCRPHQVKHLVIFQQGIPYGGKKQQYKLSSNKSAPYLFMQTLTEHIQMIKKKGRAFVKCT